jgi:flagellar hook-length control protein FliK
MPLIVQRANIQTDVDHTGSVGMSATEQDLVASMPLIVQRANIQTDVDHTGSVGMSATEQDLVANMLLIAQRANTQTELQRLPISVHQQSEGDVAIEDVDRQSLPLNAAAAANVPAGAISSVSDNAFGDKTITFAAPIVSSEVSSRPLSTTMVADNGVNLNATNLMATAVKANHMAQEQDQSFSSKQQAHTDQLLSQLTAQAGDDLQTLSSSDSFSGLMQTLSSTTTLSPNLSGMSTPISLRHPQWSQDIGHRVQMMVNEQINEIELNLDPATLGPMKIKLNMDESQSAHVRLSAQHGLTRELLENALPRLRDMLAEQGIQLGSATVDAGSRQQQDTASHQGTKNNVSHTEVDQDADNLHSAPLIKHAIDRLVDQFA